MLAPIPAAGHAAGLSPWQSTKEGLRYLRTRQALQGVYLIDINAMVFGMPRALFPAMAGAVFGGGTITLGFLYAAPGVGRAHRRRHHRLGRQPAPAGLGGDRGGLRLGRWPSRCSG